MDTGKLFTIDMRERTTRSICKSLSERQNIVDSMSRRVKFAREAGTGQSERDSLHGDTEKERKKIKSRWKGKRLGTKSEHI